MILFAAVSFLLHPRQYLKDRKEGQRVELYWLIKEAMEDTSRPAGPTTDAATVATRVFETGRVKVRFR